jgi:hypothetical protein
MTSSREDDPADKALSLLQQIRESLVPREESVEEKARRLEATLSRVADILTIYGANIYTLVAHQIQLVRILSDIEGEMASRASKVPLLPFQRSGVLGDDNN